MLSADCVEFKVNIKELIGVNGTEQLIVSIQNASALQDNYTVLLVAFVPILIARFSTHSTRPA